MVSYLTKPYSQWCPGKRGGRWYAGWGWGIPEAGRLPRRSWGESGWLALGAWAWGWVNFWLSLLSPPGPVSSFLHVTSPMQGQGKAGRQLLAAPQSPWGFSIHSLGPAPTGASVARSLCLHSGPLCPEQHPPSLFPTTPLLCYRKHPFCRETGQESDLGFLYWICVWTWPSHFAWTLVFSSWEGAV